MLPKTIEHLLHVEEIKQLKARYCRLIDSKQWNRLPDLFAQDARFEGFTIVSECPSAAMFVAALAKRLDGSVTVHHCHTPEIRILGPTKARGIWAMTDLVEWPDATALANAPSATGFCGYGFYEEAYRIENGSWRIALMRLTRIRFDPMNRGVRDLRHDPFSGMTKFLRPSQDWLSED